MNEIIKIISEYSKVYKEFERLQKAEELAGGDQKTGVIGEYYAKLYIESVIKGGDIKYAENGAPWDIVYTIDSDETKIQVKTVSFYSKTRTIAPLNMSPKAFDFLYLISLNKNFKPNGFYINNYKDIEEKLNDSKCKNKLKIGSTKMKGVSYLGKKCNGSKIYDFKVNLYKEIKIK